MAPGLTWAYEGADGGELLAAAVVNGVPHPPGYPLYTPLLRAWLTGVGWILPHSNLAWRGNLLSALFAALSVGITALTIGCFIRQQLDDATQKEQPDPPSTQQSHPNTHWIWAVIAGCAFAIAPLFWGQALITEVYTLHVLLISLLGYALLGQQGNPRFLIPTIALGVAHNATFLLLLPAAFYYLWSDKQARLKGIQLVATFAIGGLLGLGFYARIPLVAAHLPPPPVNWGYADGWSGFLWLTTAQAYRGYFLDFPLQELFGRLTNWAYLLTDQFTIIGFGLVILGLAYLDSLNAHFRNFILLWIAPVSLYSIGYYTRDNDIYLLPTIWIFALLLAVGLHTVAKWSTQRWQQQNSQLPSIQNRSIPILALKILGVLGIALLLLTRIPMLSLREDRAAQRFVTDVATTIDPQSIVVSSGDQETFALWYGAWATGELLQAAPGTMLVNDSLYQFSWYQRLLSAQYPELKGVGLPFEAFLAQNLEHAIYTSELFADVDETFFTPIGPLWQYRPVTTSAD